MAKRQVGFLCHEIREPYSYQKMAEAKGEKGCFLQSAEFAITNSKPSSAHSISGND